MTDHTSTCVSHPFAHRYDLFHHIGAWLSNVFYTIVTFHTAVSTLDTFRHGLHVSGRGRECQHKNHRIKHDF